jgi:hypothetical protein
MPAAYTAFLVARLVWALSVVTCSCLQKLDAIFVHWLVTGKPSYSAELLQSRDPAAGTNHIRQCNQISIDVDSTRLGSFEENG